MAIFHFKHSYLNWRVIPYKRRIICVFFAVFHHFVNIFLLLDSHLDLVEFSKCMTWQSIFLLLFVFLFFLFFCFFAFFFFHFLVLMACPLRATTHAIDDLSSRNISSHVRIILKGLAFWFEVARITSVQRKIGSKVFSEKWAIFGQCALRHQSMWF